MTDPARHQLAGLAALGSLVEIAMRALVQSYPQFGRGLQETDGAEVRSATALVDLCGRLLAAIDRHRRLVVRNLTDEDRDWPF